VKAAELFDVAGLAVAITGGANGLGRAFAEVMVDNGARVMLLDRDEVELERSVQALGGRGGTVESRLVDVTDRRGLEQAIDETVDRLGKLDVVFANAGIDAGPGFLSPDGERNPDGAIENIPYELWDKVIATNLTSMFTTIRAAARHMKKRRKGRIILTASIAGLRPGAIVGTPYLIAKSGVAHLVKQTALELARYGILVNAIVPGPFLTNLTTPELKKRFEAGSPLHRVGTTEEIQGLALFLASPASSYITGTHLVIDGGAMLGRAD
jgi:NAD(P)-dependent dehydrogenase (short-subunit alcohol dehydrogenase family)